jgi:SsrA-binding protein
MKIISLNRKAFHNYTIVSKLVAGIVLSGAEVKSCRSGGLNLTESYAIIKNEEAFLLNSYIPPYSHSFLNSEDKDGKRRRKLLLNKREIVRLLGETSRKGLTIVPLKAFFNEKSCIKIEIGLAKHKNLINKKRDLKDKDLRREEAKTLKNKF